MARLILEPTILVGVVTSSLGLPELRSLGRFGIDVSRSTGAGLSSVFDFAGAFLACLALGMLDGGIAEHRARS